jgi:hypothetical protein
VRVKQVQGASKFCDHMKSEGKGKKQTVRWMIGLTVKNHLGGYVHSAAHHLGPALVYSGIYDSGQKADEEVAIIYIAAGFCFM